MRTNIEDFFTGRGLSEAALFERGDLLLPSSLPPCELKILIVLDSDPEDGKNLSFSHSALGLSAVLDTLRDNPEFFVRFNITRAHRQKDRARFNPAAHPELDSDAQAALREKYDPHFENFRFTQTGFNIDEYDQIWLFGIRGPNDPQHLSDDELEKLARWMDEKKGGLFAVGDHSGLGASLCSRVPRARTMRKWTQGNPPGALNDAARHDTTLTGRDDCYDIDDESDDVPMTITPARYRFRSWDPFRANEEPHPILCGTDGVINILPDHIHEGEVINVPEDVLNGTFTINSFTAQEYPMNDRVRPEVIATAHVLSGHPSTVPANPKSFGAIGAYNGHRAGVGRVVVDSSWHHWVDVNLTGTIADKPNCKTDPKTCGFFASAEGLAAYARIQNYHRNVPIWLAKPENQRKMLLRAIWGIIQRYPLVEVIRRGLPTWQLGKRILNNLDRGITPCMLRWWIADLFPAELKNVFEAPQDTGPLLTEPPMELFEIYILGGITQEFLALIHSQENGGGVDETAIADAFVKGADTGLNEMKIALDKSLSKSKEKSDEAERLSKDILSAKSFL